MKKRILIDHSTCLALLLSKKTLDNGKAYRLFSQIESKQIRADISIISVLELVRVLEQHYSLNKKDFCLEISQLLSFKAIRIVEIKKADCLDLLRRYEHSRNSIVDTYVLLLSNKHNLVLASFNRKMIGGQRNWYRELVQ